MGPCRARRRQERVPRRNGGEPRDQWREGATWICDDCRRLLALCRVNGLKATISSVLSELESRKTSLGDAGQTIRRAFLRGEWPKETADAIRVAYHELGRRAGKDDPDVAVRSSATAEDLPNASFAGQQETYLNVRGERLLLDACRRCYASLFTDRAISYRQAKGFDHLDVALSIGVQRMVRSDLAGAGVMFRSTRKLDLTRWCSSTRPGAWARTLSRVRSTLTNMRCSSRFCPTLHYCLSSRRSAARRRSR